MPVQAAIEERLTDAEVDAAVQALQVHHRALRRKKSRLQNSTSEMEKQTTDADLANVHSAMRKMQDVQAERDSHESA